MTDNGPPIRYLFEPRSVAVIGVSTNRNKLGYKVYENIVEGGFRGHAYAVNPRGGRILDRPVHENVNDIEGDLDMAVVTVPADRVMDVVEDCGKKGVGFLVVITSGFSEIGAVALERSIADRARKLGMRLVGPNIFGIYSSAVSLNATFGPRNVLAGNVGVISQSGAIGSAMIGKTSVENLGMSSFISVGNKADVDEADLLDYLAEDPVTKVVLMYIEGVKDGESFIEAVRRASAKKPVVIIKSGRSRRGAIAAASHTGSLAGADEVFDAVARQAGAIRAESMQEAIDWCKFLVSSPKPLGPNTLIVTNGGGIGVLASDACERYNVELVEPSQTMREVIGDFVPPFGSVKNPVDLTGQARAEDYDQSLRASQDIDGIDAIICLYCETAVLDAEGLTQVVRDRWDDFRNTKPIVFSFFGGAALEESVHNLRREGIPVFSDVYEAVSCLGALMRYQGPVDKPTRHSTFDPGTLLEVEKVVEGALCDGRDFLLAQEARRVLEVVGIPMPMAETVTTMREAVDVADSIGYPVAMKVVSRDILHKSDAGGVALDLDDTEELVDAYQAIMGRCRTFDPSARIDGIEVAQMVTEGLETIVGARRDSTYGPILMFGLGGIHVEILKDVTFRSMPVGKGEVMRMMSEIRSYPLLLGVRGEEKKDLEGIANALLRVGALIEECQRIADIEINPLVALDQGDGVIALDTRIILKKP